MERVYVGWLALVATLGAAMPAIGQQAEPAAPPTNDRWTVSVAPYLWAAAMDGHASVAGARLDVDVPFKDTLKDLSGGAMLLVSLEKGRFGIAVDGLFARVSPDSEVGDVEIDASAQLAVGPFYRLLEWQYGTSSSGRPLLLVVAPEAGFRLTHMRTEIEIRGGSTVDGSETWVDPLLGSRIRLGLSDRWGIAAEGNFGGFGVGSDFTWNAQAFVGYEASLFGRPVTTWLGYRALSQDYDHNDFEWDVTMHGPVLGSSVRFCPPLPDAVPRRAGSCGGRVSDFSAPTPPEDCGSEARSAPPRRALAAAASRWPRTSPRLHCIAPAQNGRTHPDMHARNPQGRMDRLNK
jgi:hypothetical protein